MTIKVIGGGWNIQSLDSTQKLADAVYEIFSILVGKELEHDILVNNDFSQGYPLAHYEKNNDCWEITLSCASGTHWAQVGYQLAHELCHLYSNHSLSRGHKHKWFEESLCECASIAVLSKLGADWTNFSISEHNSNYGVSVTSYIQDVKDSVTHQFDSNTDFCSWLSSMIPQLEISSTQRDLNKAVAVFMFNSLFSNSQNAWSAVITLNLWDCFKDIDFNSFVDNWLLSSNGNNNEVTSIVGLLRA
ncbi:conserved hypothetical protein [Vibrio chagasii]|nr:conserved hypothetical protein [Vibrio chagasii]